MVKDLREKPRTEKFRIGELFDIHPTCTYKLTNSELFSLAGETPVLSNSERNNGIAGYCGLKPTEPGGIITFSDTASGADTMFYQPRPFIGYPHVQGMYPYQEGVWDEASCLYAISCARRSSGNIYSYAAKYKRTIVRDIQIELPIVESADPGHVYTPEDIDWAYMREYISELEAERVRELEQERAMELEAYLKAAGLNDYELTQEEKDILTLHRRGIKTRAFRLSALFQVFHGKRLKREDRIPGSIPLLTAGEQNQGVACYIGNDAEIYNNAISIDMFGNCFYHDGIFAGDDNIYFFVNEGYAPKAKEYIAAAVSKTTKGVYSYSLQFRQPSADQLEVELPVSPSGQPDFSFMEKYITALEKQTIAGVVRYKDRVIETAKALIQKA